MKCHEVKAKIYLYLDGEVSQQEQARLFDHLKECPACLQEMDMAKRMHELLSKHCTLVEDVPADFRDSIMGRLNLNKQIPQAQSLVKHRAVQRRKFWQSRLGMGLVAGIIGLFFTYVLTLTSPSTNIANKNTVPLKNTNTNKSTENNSNRLAELQGGKDNNTPQKALPIKNSSATQNLTKPAKGDKPANVLPVVKPPQVAMTKHLVPNSGTVPLPRPSTVSTLTYNPSAGDNPVPNADSVQQPLVAKIQGQPSQALAVGSKLEIATKLSDTTAKLWLVENRQTVKVKEIDVQDVKGTILINNGKLTSVDAAQAAISSSGEIAKITSNGEKNALTFGDFNTTLDGKVSGLSWSPDGKKVVYYLENGKLGHLESFDGTNRVQLISDLPAQNIVWTFLSADKILLNIKTDLPGIWELHLPDFKLRPLADIGGGKCIAVNKTGDVAFTDSSDKLYVLLHDATAQVKLLQMTTEGKPITHLVWQDDKTLLFVSVRDGQTEIRKTRLP